MVMSAVKQLQLKHGLGKDPSQLVVFGGASAGWVASSPKHATQAASSLAAALETQLS